MEDFYTTKTNGIVTLTVRTGLSLNVMISDVLAALNSAIRSYSEDSPPKALILMGENEFLGGLKVNELSKLGPIETSKLSESGDALCNAIEEAPFPVIAAVNGLAIGGGLEIATACDLTIVSHQASFVLIEAITGLPPGFGGTWRLPQRIGQMRARLMAFTGKPIDANTAVKWGLALEAVKPDTLQWHCQEIAEQICTNSQSTICEAKRLLSVSNNGRTAYSHEVEESTIAALFGEEEKRKRIDHLVGIYSK